YVSSIKAVSSGQKQSKGVDLQDTQGTAVPSREPRDIYLRLGIWSVVLRSSAPPYFSSKPVGILSFPKACQALPYHLPQRTQARSVVVPSARSRPRASLVAGWKAHSATASRRGLRLCRDAGQIMREDPAA
ncbi:MAG: hypothetical protein K0R61_4767, partial [Microvirga sp.]|nr:hypothetical protein [Microvirga sp.]